MMDVTTVLGLAADRTAVENWAPINLYNQLSVHQNVYFFNNFNLAYLKVSTLLACWAFAVLILCARARVCVCVYVYMYRIYI